MLRYEPRPLVVEVLPCVTADRGDPVKQYAEVTYEGAAFPLHRCRTRFVVGSPCIPVVS